MITGGSKGIGLGIAQAMLDQGMQVVITGRNKQTIDESVDQPTPWRYPQE